MPVSFPAPACSPCTRRQLPHTARRRRLTPRRQVSAHRPVHARVWPACYMRRLLNSLAIRRAMQASTRTRRLTPARPRQVRCQAHASAAAAAGLRPAAMRACRLEWSCGLSINTASWPYQPLGRQAPTPPATARMPWLMAQWELWLAQPWGPQVRGTAEEQPEACSGAGRPAGRCTASLAGTAPGGHPPLQAGYLM